MVEGRSPRTWDLGSHSQLARKSEASLILELRSWWKLCYPKPLVQAELKLGMNTTQKFMKFFHKQTPG